MSDKLPIIIDGNRTINKWASDLSSEEYHSDKTSVSSSGIREMLRSPMHFHSYHTGLAVREETKSMRIGTLVHSLVLEPEKFKASYLVQPDFGDQRSSKNRERKKRWLEDIPPGRTVITQDESELISQVAMAIANHPKASTIFNKNKEDMVEASGFYTDPDTKILCRVRPDFYSKKKGILIDVKTTIDASKSAFARSIHRYGYHVQMAMYSHGIEVIDGKAPNYCVFLAVENKPPFAVSMYHADIAMMELGEKKYRRGMNQLKSCLKTNEWPGYQQEIEPIGLPEFAFWEEE